MNEASSLLAKSCLYSVAEFSTESFERTNPLFVPESIAETIGSTSHVRIEVPRVVVVAAVPVGAGALFQLRFASVHAGVAVPW